jgi:hypothetical protein
VHPPELRAAALELVARGLNDCEISRRIGVNRRTISDWRRQPYARKTEAATCSRCWRPAKPTWFTTADYAELLGFYLGDGCISVHPRTQRLRIALDAKYPGIIEAARGLLVACFPLNQVDVIPYREGDCFAVSIYSAHLTCVLPQHGAGRKHKRKIDLEPWQEAILEAEPWSFIRACIWTDGCAFINRTGPYEYLSYDFTNYSTDIADLFVEACGRVGVEYRRTNYRGAWKIRINRRPSVALMLEHVGRKE